MVWVYTCPHFSSGRSAVISGIVGGGVFTPVLESRVLPLPPEGCVAVCGRGRRVTSFPLSVGAGVSMETPRCGPLRGFGSDDGNHVTPCTGAIFNGTGRGCHVTPIPSSGLPGDGLTGLVPEYHVTPLPGESLGPASRILCRSVPLVLLLWPRVLPDRPIPNPNPNPNPVPIPMLPRAPV
eukprot:g19578.t1